MLGENIKIHYAGADDWNFYIPLEITDCHYSLYSFYKYSKSKSLILPENSFLKHMAKQQKHVIQDSGLFTMMFGAKSGGRIHIMTSTDI